MLRHFSTERLAPLRATMTIGRAPSCDLVLKTTHASASHALLTWDGTGWTVKDLASTNGTYVRGQAIEPGASVALAVGDDVAFGDPTDRWWLLSAEPPGLFAESLSGGPRVEGTEGVLGLPSSDAPRAMVFSDGLQWVFEDDEGTHPVNDRDMVCVGGAFWRVGLPDLLSSTTPLDSDGVRLRVRGRAARAHIELRGQSGWTEVPRLKAHRLLWTLAREWVAEAERPVDERGFTHVDLVARDLGIAASTVDVDVYRIRAQFAGLGAPDLIERRKGVGQLRLRAAAIDFDPGG